MRLKLRARHPIAPTPRSPTATRSRWPPAPAPTSSTRRPARSCSPSRTSPASSISTGALTRPGSPRPTGRDDQGVAHHRTRSLEVCHAVVAGHHAGASAGHGVLARRQCSRRRSSRLRDDAGVGYQPRRLGRGGQPSRRVFCSAVRGRVHSGLRHHRQPDRRPHGLGCPDLRTRSAPLGGPDPAPAPSQPPRRWPSRRWTARV